MTFTKGDDYPAKCRIVPLLPTTYTSQGPIPHTA